jgi:hypothetical protein
MRRSGCLRGCWFGRFPGWAGYARAHQRTVYELADLGVTIVPVKSQTGPVNTAMGRLLWAIQSWYGEMENEDRSENVRLEQARARAQGKEIGRPRDVANDVQERILTMRASGHGYKAISQATGVPRSTVRRILKGAETMPKTQAANSSYHQFRSVRFCRVPEVVVYGTLPRSDSGSGGGRRNTISIVARAGTQAPSRVAGLNRQWATAVIASSSSPCPKPRTTRIWCAPPSVPTSTVSTTVPAMRDLRASWLYSGSAFWITTGAWSGPAHSGSAASDCMTATADKSKGTAHTMD